MSRRHRELCYARHSTAHARRRVIAGLGLLLGAVIGVARLAGAQDGNPLEGDADAIRAGQPMYQSRCSDCHSADARGVRGPDLTQVWTSGRSDADLFATVRDGVEGTIMPPSQASDDEIWAILAYLRSISIVPPFEIPGASPTNGRALFDDQCSGCHVIDGRGGALGPDLTRIGLSRSREALERSIRDPNESVESGFRTVRLVTSAGLEIEGVVKSEDAFSLLVVDKDDRLQGYLKRDLTVLERPEDSLMPRFARRRLDNAELNDLLAYLATLRGD